MSFTEKQQKQIVRLYRDGASQSDLAGQFKTYSATIGRILRQRGIQIRNSPRRVTQEDVDQIKALYLSGMSVEEVGGVVGRRSATVSRVCKELGITRARGVTKRRRVSNETRDKAVSLYQEGMTLDEIETELGITRTIIYSELKKRGVPRRGAGSRGRFHNAPEKRKQIADAYERGCSMALLCSVYKCSQDPIKKILKEHEIEPRKEIPGQRGYQFIDRKSREHWMRSSWEIKTARWLDDQERDWDYEKETYEIGPKKRYTPDFWLYASSGALELIIDVKGWLYEDSASRIALFLTAHPALPFEIWTQELLAEKGILEIEINLPLEIRQEGLRSCISKAEIQEAIRLYESGLSVGQVAEALNRSESAIARQLQLLGKTRDRYQTRKMMGADQEARDLVAQTYLSGLSMTKTAEKLGLSRDIVSKEISTRGISRTRSRAQLLKTRQVS